MSPLCLAPGKKIDIWVFLEVQEIDFLGPLNLNLNIVYLYMNFSFYEKVSSALDHPGFFPKYFTTPQLFQPK